MVERQCAVNLCHLCQDCFIFSVIRSGIKVFLRCLEKKYIIAVFHCESK